MLSILLTIWYLLNRLCWWCIRCWWRRRGWHNWRKRRYSVPGWVCNNPVMWLTSTSYKWLRVYTLVLFIYLVHWCNGLTFVTFHHLIDYITLIITIFIISIIIHRLLLITLTCSQWHFSCSLWCSSNTIRTWCVQMAWLGACKSCKMFWCLR